VAGAIRFDWEPRVSGVRPQRVKKRAVVIVSEAPLGALVARDLAGSPEVAVTLVTPTRTPVWPSLLPGLLSGRLPLGAVAEPIALPAAVNVRLAEVLAIDPTERRLSLLDKITPREPRAPEASYDELVFVPSKAPGVPAAFSHALPLASDGDARRIIARVAEALELAATEDSERRRTSLATIVVVGGGAHGVAIAGEVRSLLDRLLPLYGRVAPREARVVLIERQETLLPKYPALASAAAAELTRLGVSIRLRTVVETIAEDHVVALTEGESTRIDTRVVIYAGGTAPSPHLARWAGVVDWQSADIVGKMTTAPAGLRVVGPWPTAVAGPSLGRERQRAAALAASLLGQPVRAPATNGGSLVLGEGAVARATLGAALTAPFAVRGGPARLIAAFDRTPGHLGGAAFLQRFSVHLSAGRAAPLPLTLVAAAGGAAFPSPLSLPSFFDTETAAKAPPPPTPDAAPLPPFRGFSP
jgi:NADH dehydrogenase FAD-containing subunit